MSTHNICFREEIKNINTFGLKKALTRAMDNYGTDCADCLHFLMHDFGVE